MKQFLHVRLPLKFKHNRKRSNHNNRRKTYFTKKLFQKILKRPKHGCEDKWRKRGHSDRAENVVCKERYFQLQKTRYKTICEKHAATLIAVTCRIIV